MTVKINYQDEAHIFLRLKEKGEKLTQAAYCKMRSDELGVTMSPGYFGRVLRQVRDAAASSKEGGQIKQAASGEKSTQNITINRHDWDALKAEFLSGPYKTISEFARDKDMCPTSSHLRKMTRGWKETKDKQRIISDAHTQEKIIQEKAAEKFQALYVDAMAAQLELFQCFELLAGSYRNWKKEKTTQFTSWKGAQFLVEMQNAIERILPNIRGLEKLADINAVFDKLADGDINVARAAIELTRFGVRLPRFLEIMLAKYQPEEPAPDDGDEITDAMILERRKAMLLEIEEERAVFVPGRKKYVAKLKEEMKGQDSFAAQTIDEGA